MKLDYLLSLEVVGKSALEDLCSEEVIHHANYRGAFGVGYTVEYFVNLVRMSDRYGNWMGRLESVETEYVL